MHVIVAKLVRYILVRSVQERMHGPLALTFQDKLLLPFAFQDEMIKLFAFALALQPFGRACSDWRHVSCFKKFRHTLSPMLDLITIGLMTRKRRRQHALL